MAADDKSPEELNDDHAVEGDDPDEGSDEGDAPESDGSEGDSNAEESEGDHAEDDDGEEDSGDVEDEPAAAAPARKRTASDVIREQKRDRKEAARRAEEAQRRAEEAERRVAEAERRAAEAERRAQERQRTESAEDEARRLEVMSESERLAYYRDKDRKEFDGRFSTLERRMWDSADRADFRALVREDPLVAKVQDKVEEEFQRLWNSGSPVRREILAELFIGRMTRAERGKAVAKQRERGAEKLKRETVKPTRTRSTVPAERTKRTQEDPRAARRRRLEDVQL